MTEIAIFLLAFLSLSYAIFCFCSFLKESTVKNIEKKKEFKSLDDFIKELRPIFYCEDDNSFTINKQIIVDGMPHYLNKQELEKDIIDWCSENNIKVKDYHEITRVNTDNIRCDLCHLIYTKLKFYDKNDALRAKLIWM